MRDFESYAKRSAKMLNVHMKYVIDDDVNFFIKKEKNDALTKYLKRESKTARLLNVFVLCAKGSVVYATTTVDEFTEKRLQSIQKNSVLEGVKHFFSAQNLKYYYAFDEERNNAFVTTISLSEKISNDQYTVIADFDFSKEYKNAWHDICTYFLVLLILSISFFSFFLFVMRRYQEQTKKYIQDIKIEREKAIVSSRAKTVFLETMSHEIRTPIAGFLGVLELLRSTKINTKQKELIRLGIESGEHLKMILNDILDFSKLETGEFKVDKEVFSLFERVDSFIQMNKCAAEKEKPGVDILFDYEVNTNVLIESDPLRLMQILQNLLSNALKFTKFGYVKLTIKNIMKNNQEYLLFSIEDTGIGVAKEAQNKLFEKFTQADEKISRIYGGTGLGLAITKKLTELLGGAIYFESVLGQGSTFYVEIPFVKVEASIFKRDQDKTPYQPKQKLSILIVEDNIVNQKVLTSLLKRDHHQTVAAKSGIEALAIFQKNKFDVVFMDIQMPGMDGVETTEKMRDIEESDNRKPSFIIACSADVFFDQNTGEFDAFLEKPINIQRMRELLDKYF